MNEEGLDIVQLLEDSADNSAEVQTPDPESLFDLLEKKALLKEALSALDEEQFKKYAVKITQLTIKKTGLNVNNLGLHFLRGNAIRGISREGFRPSFYSAKGATRETHRTIDYWLFDEQTSILDLDEKMNDVYRKSGNTVSTDFVLINRKFIANKGKEEFPSPNKRWKRGVLSVAILEDESCPAETIFGLGALSPLGITDIRQLNNGSNIMDNFSLGRKEIRESGENAYLNDKLTRNNKIDMLLRFLESLAYIATQRKMAQTKD